MWSIRRAVVCTLQCTPPPSQLSSLATVLLFFSFTSQTRWGQLCFIFKTTVREWMDLTPKRFPCILSDGCVDVIVSELTSYPSAFNERHCFGSVLIKFYSGTVLRKPVSRVTLLDHNVLWRNYLTWIFSCPVKNWTFWCLKMRPPPYLETYVTNHAVWRGATSQKNGHLTRKLLTPNKRAKNSSFLCKNWIIFTTIKFFVSFA